MAVHTETLSIGVTGHRPERLGRENLDRVAAMVGEALDAVAEAARAQSDAVRLRLVSALAQGADALAADGALARGWSLDCVLPFDREAYAIDFPQADDKDAFRRRLEAAHAVFELSGRRAARSDPRAYERAGRVVLAQCDILLAVWDRGPLQGRGGTGQIVAEAVIEDVPVILIDPTGAHPPALLWDGLQEHDLGQQTLETVPRSDLTALPQVAEALLGRPDQMENPAVGQFHSDAPLPRRTLALAFPLLLALVGVRGLRGTDFMVPDPRRAEGPVLDLTRRMADRAPAFAEAARTVLAPAFARADVLATYIGQLFRSGYVINFSLAAAAVALALSGLALPPAAKPFLIILELSAIAGILILTRTAHRVGWHQRWLDCRHLAERLRCLALSAQLGDLALRIGADAEPAWVTGVARETARRLGLPSARVDEDYLSDVRGALLGLIDDQLAYLSADARRMHRLEHRLHMVGTVLFAVTALICVGFLIFDAVFRLGAGEASEAMVHRVAIGVTIASGALPAIGAAIYGIRMQGDFAGVAERSEGLAHHLLVLRHAIEADLLTFDTLRRRVRHAVDLLTADLAQWRQTYTARPLSLPG